jgi:hypothetical protein
VEIMAVGKGGNMIQYGKIIVMGDAPLKEIKETMDSIIRDHGVLDSVVDANDDDDKDERSSAELQKDVEDMIKEELGEQKEEIKEVQPWLKRN